MMSEGFLGQIAWRYFLGAVDVFGGAGCGDGAVVVAGGEVGAGVVDGGGGGSVVGTRMDNGTEPGAFGVST